MTPLELLIDLHAPQARQGPGSDAATRRAIELAGLKPSTDLAIADVGCGTGASALVLARELGACVTAVDAMPEFIDRLRARAARARLDARIRPAVERMEALAFKDESLDAIWSEGAIYNMGFEAGVRAWRRLLKPRGVLAVSDLSWTTGARPRDIEDHWEREYAGIDTPSGKFRVLERAGYTPIGFFFLPRDCWEENYYTPLEAGMKVFLTRHPGIAAARSIVEDLQQEINFSREHGQWFGYGFYIARRSDGV